jgi:twitching motility protein PilT
MTKETLDALLGGMLQIGSGVSDLLFISGKPPLVEDQGRLQEFAIDTPGSVLTPALIESMALHLIAGSERLLSEFAESGSCDCSYQLGEVRFRANVFKQNGQHAIVMRRLQSDIPTLDRLNLPPIFRQIIKEKNGIVLVTGGTGSGKTTTLAAMVDELNKTQEIHVVTLEDPIEFLHRHHAGAISQRELGKDFQNFPDGLRAALRQAPKVILVGEIRDRLTMEIAMTAAETGHVVYSTLHTINAGQTINRILGFFSREEEQQLRQRIAETLRYVVSQRLVPKVGGGRMLMTEIMGSSLRSRETTVYGESENKSYQEIIESGSTMGWHSFDQSLLRAYNAGEVEEETALLFCTNQGRMRRDLDQIGRRRGAVATDAPSGLKLDIPPPISMADLPPDTQPLTVASTR